MRVPAATTGLSVTVLARRGKPWARRPTLRPPRTAVSTAALGNVGEAEHGRLGARPAARAGAQEEAPGTRWIRAGDRAEGLLHVPQVYRSDRHAPLLVVLHGAGSGAEASLALLRELADEKGLLLLAPDARGQTWDLIAEGRFGRDAAAIDGLMRQVFGRFAVDPTRVALAGFSDGASYALSLGLTNGDLFTHVIAFSPGFVRPGARRGEPALFMSHGVADHVLPIDRCSRRIVPALRRAGYELRYREFDGGHTMPPEVAEEALEGLRRDPTLRLGD